MRGWLDIETTDTATGDTCTRRWDNLICVAGTAYYTSRIAQATPAQFVDGGGVFDGVIELGTAGAAPASTSTRANVTTKITGSQRACDSGFPRTDDPDALNPLTGLFMSDGGSSPQLEQTVTYKFSFPAGTFTGINIDRAIITNPSPGASEPVLAYTTGTPFTVNATTTVVIRWNHRLQAAND